MLSSQSLTPPPLRGRSARSAGRGVLRNADPGTAGARRDLSTAKSLSCPKTRYISSSNAFPPIPRSLSGQQWLPLQLTPQCSGLRGERHAGSSRAPLNCGKSSACLGNGQGGKVGLGLQQRKGGDPMSSDTGAPSMSLGTFRGRWSSLLRLA